MSMQGLNANIFRMNDKINSFKEKLELWQSRTKKSDFECFPTLNYFKNDIKFKVKSETRKLFIQHLKDIKSSLDYYFPDNLLIKEEEWIRYPFNKTPINFSYKETEEKIELKNDGELKIKFETELLENFWLGLENKFPELSERAVKFLMPFTTTYLCEKSFSSMIYIKNKYRSRIRDLDSRLRLKLSELGPNFIELVKNSHKDLTKFK